MGPKSGNKYYCGDWWHSANEHPKSQHFEPTGCLNVRWKNGHYGVLHRNIFQSVIRLAESQDNPLTHWREITPPQ